MAMALDPDQLDDDVLTFLRDFQDNACAKLRAAMSKVLIYMGHVMRTEVQQRRIRTIDRTEVLKPSSTGCKIICDFKMKLLPIECKRQASYTTKSAALVFMVLL